MMLGWESSHHPVVAICAGDVGGHIATVDAGDGGGVIVVVVVVVSIDGHVDDVDGGGCRRWWPCRRRWWWGHRCPHIGGGH